MVGRGLGGECGTRKEERHLGKDWIKGRMMQEEVELEEWKGMEERMKEVLRETEEELEKGKRRDGGIRSVGRKRRK